MQLFSVLYEYEGVPFRTFSFHTHVTLESDGGDTARVFKEEVRL